VHCRKEAGAGRDAAGSLEEGLHGRLQCMQCRSSSHARESFDFDDDQEMKLKWKCIQEPERVLLGVAYGSHNSTSQDHVFVKVGDIH
jgi:hypothetical protein